jgi:Ca-activated chloride channel family protein
MTAKDFSPDRFTVAKQSLIEFVNSLDTHYNISLIAFSGKPFIYFPFTDSKKAIIWKISHMSFADFPPTLDFV